MSSQAQAQLNGDEMAHFAELDSNNNVLRVIVVNNSVIEKDGVEDEATGVEFCKGIFGSHTIWVQTSYNGSFRYNYAGPGFKFDPEAAPKGAFYSPSPYPSWVLNKETYVWQSPVAYPTDGKDYFWNESKRDWEVAVIQTQEQ